MNLRSLIYLFFIVLAFTGTFSACTDMVPTHEIRLIDSLNSEAYKYRYKNLDSSGYYAQEAYSKINLYKSGKAEACNNLGFQAFMNMDFDKAERLHKEVYKFAKNELELLVADIGLMKISQRTAMNKEFYDYRNRALKRMKRIREDSDLFIDRHEQLRLNFAFSEFYIVSAIYYYYLQQRSEAFESLSHVNEEEIATDTNQILYFHYIKGATSLCQAETPDEELLLEFDELYKTWRIASQRKDLYFEGNSLQGLAALMISSEKFEFFKARRLHAIEKLATPVDSLLPLHLAESALNLFKEYGDLYQTAGTYVTIGKYYNAHGRYDIALDTLIKALDCVNKHHLLRYHKDKTTFDKLVPYSENVNAGIDLLWDEHPGIKTVPEWISRIREQLSVSYAGLGLKRASDYNRNIYLAILNFTRQDKELESRYLSLEAESKQLTLVMFAVIIGLFFLIIFLIFFNKRTKVRNQLYMERLQNTLDLCKDIMSSIPMDTELIQQGLDRLFGPNRLKLEIDEDKKAIFTPMQRLNKEEKALVLLLQPYVDWALDNEQVIEELSDEQLMIEKQRYIYEQHISGNKRQNIIKKACMAIVNGIHPYIDRILNEVSKLLEKGYIEKDNIKKDKLQYIDELVSTINEYNDILALWIKMKQGSLSLNIETFELNPLFELLNKGRRAFEMKNQKFVIVPTQVNVKADKALTLFMINTLAENARKYTPEGGEIKIYATTTDNYVEISVEDTGIGLSIEDLNHILEEKIYDSRAIGMKAAENPDLLKKNKGSGFGLMNCKGIIEKYRKTNDLFRVCLFNIESEPGKGSRFYFRLPLGIRKLMVIIGICFIPFLMGACMEETSPHTTATHDALELSKDSTNENLLDSASEYANYAYYANVNKHYEKALSYVDSAIVLLNKDYDKYAPAQKERHYMTLVGEGTPAEIHWWNTLFNSDFHVILDLRNEASVAFLALKQLDNYNYNNSAFTDLYKLQSEDQSLETYCRQLELSTINKTIGIILCFILLATYLVIYYLVYMRKRLQNRLNLEQVLEINKKVFTASVVRSEDVSNLLEREENTLKQIPQRIVNESYDYVNELLTCHCMGIAVYNETTHRLEYASQPHQPMPGIIESCFTSQKYLSENEQHALPLIVEVHGDKRCIGVLYIERRSGTEQPADDILLELVGRYVAIAIFNAVITLAMKYRDIESAQEEAYRASWEDSMLHVQNMVLDNCLSTIKHETIYYPNKIKQIIDRINLQQLSPEEERQAIESITELIEYYKGIFSILSSCASRQLEEVTFRRTTIQVQDLFDAAEKYFKKATKGGERNLTLITEPCHEKIIGDTNLLRFLFENLIDEAMSFPEKGELHLKAYEEEAFVRFLFTDKRRNKSIEELNALFYPSLKRLIPTEKGDLKGTEYLICKQIIRDHDEFAGRRGCRINAELAENGGFRIYFTLPKK